MASRSNDDDPVVLKISSLFRIHKSGLIVRVGSVPPVPPSKDPKTHVESKDISIPSSSTSDTTTEKNELASSADKVVPLRLFKPPNLRIEKNELVSSDNKIPILFYFHGGGFVIESTFSPKYHNYLNSLCYEAKVMIISVEYRRVPEHTLPAAYNDCWDALNWVASHGPDYNTRKHSKHIDQTVQEPWLSDRALDYSSMYLVGDSAGANIAHHMGLKIGVQGSYWRVKGIVLVHPMFWGKVRIGDEVEKCKKMSTPDLSDRIWTMACPNSKVGSDHPWHNPGTEPRLSRLGCDRVLVCVAETDYLRDRGLYYKEVLQKSGWKGSVELVESKGENHVFHLLKPFSQNSVSLMQRIVAFIHPATCKL